MVFKFYLLKKNKKVDDNNSFFYELLSFFCVLYENCVNVSSNYLEKRALANASLILHPPENVFVAWFCIVGVKPRPFKIMEARAGALSASMFCNWLYTSVSWLDSSGSADPELTAALSSFSFVNSSCLTVSHSRTLSIARVSSPITYRNCDIIQGVPQLEGHSQYKCSLSHS